GIRRGDVVINEEPCCALSCQSVQRSLRRLLNISFFCRCCAQSDSKARKSTQEPRARFGRTPTNARIKTSKAVRVLNRQCSLTHTAHSLHRYTADRRLCHGGGLVVHQNGIKPVEFFSAACETCDTRRHPDEWSWRRLQCLRTSFRSGKYTAPTLLGVP